MSENFYKAFEDRYRGSRDTIKQRQSAYLPFLAPLAGLQQPATALDLGCGRGEWLELLGEHGFAARGVDLDDGMLSSCRERGLQVETADALATLRALPDNSLALVSAFHLVEHIPFDAVQELIGQALRVLTPGGLLIMETPNPENLSVGAHTFYRDPSHLRPLPPELLLFAAEFGGFARQRIVRLQEDPALHSASVTRLQQVLEGVSPDYAVLAQKAAAPGALAAFDSAFALDFGLSFEAMAQRFDRQEDRKSRELAGFGSGLKELESHVVPLVARRHSADLELAELFAKTASLAEQLLAGRSEDRALFAEQLAQQRGVLEHRAGLAEQRLFVSEGRNHALEARSTDLEIRATSFEARAAAYEERSAAAEARSAAAEARSAAADARAEELGQQLLATLNSRSWRITAPLRAAGHLARRLRNAIRNRTLGAALRRRVHGLLLRVGRRVLQNRTAKQAAMAMLAPFPGLRARVRGMMVDVLLEASTATVTPPVADDKLSPRARQLHQQLQQAFKQKDQ
jgi:SAM-dependent methyltransferase